MNLALSLDRVALNRLWIYFGRFYLQIPISTLRGNTLSVFLLLFLPFVSTINSSQGYKSTDYDSDYYCCVRLAIFFVVVVVVVGFWNRRKSLISFSLSTHSVPMARTRLRPEWTKKLRLFPYVRSILVRNNLVRSSGFRDFFSAIFGHFRMFALSANRNPNAGNHPHPSKRTGVYRTVFAVFGKRVNFYIVRSF